MTYYSSYFFAKLVVFSLRATGWEGESEKTKMAWTKKTLIDFLSINFDEFYFMWSEFHIHSLDVKVLTGSFSTVSKPHFASMHEFCSILRALQYLHISGLHHTKHVSKTYQNIGFENQQSFKWSLRKLNKHFVIY